MWRGIKDGPNEWGYMKVEKVENVKLGEIGCHINCLTCTDPSELSCLICANNEQFLEDGRCFDDCTDENPFIHTREIVFD